MEQHNESNVSDSQNNNCIVVESIKGIKVEATFFDGSLEICIKGLEIMHVFV